MLSSINNLREIARRCQIGEPLGEELADWLAGALQKYLSQGCRTIEEALNLRFPQGGIPWWREEAIRKRDGAIRDLAERFHSHLLLCAKAREICSMAARYAASSWRFDRGGDAMPSHYAGTANELLWHAFKSGATMPIGERQLRNILVE